MAECFCGCGQKVPFLDRNLNAQGRYTVELIDKLEADREQLEQGPLVEGGDNSDAMATVHRYVEEGRIFSDLFRRAVHREPLPSPGKGNALRREWGAWRKKAAAFADLLALPIEKLEAAFRAHDEGFTTAAEQPQAPPGAIEVGPWFSAPEYQSVRYINETDEGTGLFVFINKRKAEAEVYAAAEEFTGQTSREIAESDFDLASQIEEAANRPIDPGQTQAGIAAALNNPANWVREDGDDDNARPDDEYVCMELDPMTGQVLLPGN